MTSICNIIHAFRPRTGRVKTAGNDYLDIRGCGFVTFEINGQAVTLPVLWVPSISENLLATIPLVQGGVNFTWSPAGLEIKWRRGFTSCFPIQDDKVIVVASHPVVQAEYAARTVSTDLRPTDLLHEAFGHPGHKQGNAMAKDLHTGSIPNAPCEACDTAKLHKARLPSTSKSEKAPVPLAKLHIDIMTQLSGSSSYRFALVAVDDATSFVHVHPLRNKAQALDALIDFVLGWDWEDWASLVDQARASTTLARPCYQVVLRVVTRERAKPI